MKADEVLPTSSSRVKWVCPTCHGEYYAAIRDRKSVMTPVLIVGTRKLWWDLIHY